MSLCQVWLHASYFLLVSSSIDLLFLLHFLLHWFFDDMKIWNTEIILLIWLMCCVWIQLWSEWKSNVPEKKQRRRKKGTHKCISKKHKGLNLMSHRDKLGKLYNQISEILIRQIAPQWWNTDRLNTRQAELIFALYLFVGAFKWPLGFTAWLCNVLCFDLHQLQSKLRGGKPSAV